MRYLLGLIALLSFVPAAAQIDFAPPGAEWCLEAYDENGQTIGFLRTYYAHDTVIHGLEMKVFSTEARIYNEMGRLVPLTLGDRGYLQRGDTVYNYDNVGQALNHVYQFDYEVAELTGTSLSTSLFRVREEREETFGDRTLRVHEWEVVTDPAVEREFPVVFYDWIGPDRGFFSDWGLTERGGGGEWLQAYRADTIPEITFPGGGNCFGLIEAELIDTIVALAPDCDVIVSPQPTGPSDRIVTLGFVCADVVAGDFSVAVFDGHGRLVGPPHAISGLPYALDVSRLPGGQYFAVLEGKGRRYSFPLLIHR